MMLTTIIAYLIAVFGFDMDPDKPIRVINDILKEIDVEKVANELTGLINTLSKSEVWGELFATLQKIGTDIINLVNL